MMTRLGDTQYETRIRFVASNVMINTRMEGWCKELSVAKQTLEFKACPRCQGDMISDRDIYGLYRQCLQCGHMEDMPRTSELLSMPGARDRKRVGIKIFRLLTR